jgi:peptidyl-dipeptidase A
MKINPINNTNKTMPNTNTRNQIPFKSEPEYDTFEKTSNLEDERIMANLENYRAVRDKFGKKLEKVTHDLELADWDFFTNSTDENMQRSTAAQDAMSNLYQDKDLYKKFKQIKEIGLGDKQLDKQIKNIVRDFYEEIESGDELKAIRDKQNEIANKYNSYELTIDGKPVSKAEIYKILETETNPEIRRKAYEANVKAGDVIADDLVKLVKMRNEYARSKGYDNYFDYKLEESYDISPQKLDELIDGVYSKIGDRCSEIYGKRKKELSSAFEIAPRDLRDWHYGLLTKDSPEGAVNEYFKTKEQIEDIAKKVYSQMGYDVDNMGITLDLYPRENKNTHGFAFCIKPGKDARILANLTNNALSLSTLLHELGHSVYDIEIDTRLPFVEQECSSPVMTEAIAMMMQDLPKTESILSGTVPEKVLKPFMEELKEDEAKFVTHSLRIINFEREMYKNPDQDLKKLWREMKIKYLYRGEDTPENNEWATVPHFLSHPGYYQNYFRAALLKAQIYNAMKSELGEISQNKKTAEFLKEKLFKYGSSVWEEDLIVDMTGKPLSEEDFCNRILTEG